LRSADSITGSRDMVDSDKCSETSTEGKDGAPGFTTGESFPDELIMKKLLNVLVAVAELEEVAAKGDLKAIFEPGVPVGHASGKAGWFESFPDALIMKKLLYVLVAVAKLEEVAAKDDLKAIFEPGVPVGHASGTAGWCMFAH
jgi:hypothetical protein